MRIIILFTFLIANSIFADMIVLKNGEVLIGRYLNEDNQRIKFQVFSEIKSIPKSNITSFELGYSGVPVCYQLENKWTKSCGDVIHILDKNKMVLGKGSGLMEKDEYLLKDLKEISLRKNRKEERIFYILRPGITIEVHSDGKIIKGEIKNVTFDSISIKTKDETLSFKEAEVEEISWKESPKMSLSFLRYTVPGLFQFQEGNRLKGALIGFLFLGFAGGAGAEYGAAQSALKGNVDYLIINGNLIIGSNLFANKSYENHVRNMNMAFGGMALVYLFHSYEVYSFVSSKGVKASFHMQVPSINSNSYRPEIDQGRLSRGIEFRITYSF